MTHRGNYLDRRYARTLDGLTMEELVARDQAIRADPASKSTVPGYLWIYSKSARVKLDTIAWLITALLAEKKRAENA